MRKKKNNKCPFGEELQPYWDLRYDFFSKFDKGVKIDKEGLYSVKPEISAKRIAINTKGKVVLDAFGGVGGSAIGYAVSGYEVISVELNKDRLKIAKNNAKIYGVEDKIKFVNANVLDIADELEFDAVYFDPPWGGPEYYKAKVFPLKGFNPNGNILIELAKRKKCFMAFTVPNNFDFNQIRDLNKDFNVLVDYIDNKPLYSTIFMDFNNS